MAAKSKAPALTDTADADTADTADIAPNTAAPPDTGNNQALYATAATLMVYNLQRGLQEASAITHAVDQAIALHAAVDRQRG